MARTKLMKSESKTKRKDVPIKKVPSAKSSTSTTTSAAAAPDIKNYVLEDQNIPKEVGKFRINRRVREQRDLFTATDAKYVRFVC